MKKLAIIPARGGSKRLKKKNVLPLGGKPLVAYTIEAAQKSNIFDKILLSTDDTEIANVGHSLGIEVYKRSDEYASDTATVLEALLELMETLEKKGEKYDIICQMLATCPFRKPEHIKEGMELLDKETDSVVSITTYDFPLPKSLKKNGDFITPAWPNSPFLTGKTRTQDQEIFYHDNGAFFISWWDSMIKHRNFFKGTIKGYIMHPLNTVDIDNELDLAKAQMLIDYLRNNPDAISEIKNALSHI